MNFKKTCSSMNIVKNPPFHLLASMDWSPRMHCVVVI